MRYIDCVQGSEAWHAHRLGIPTASEFENIIQPKKLEPTKSETRRKYMMRLLTERILGEPLNVVGVSALQHGHDWEETARCSYEMMKGIDVVRCGFCLNDEGTAGASPDGFVGDEGTLEVKSPERPEIHVGYLSDPSTLVDEYKIQVQGQLLISERKWTDIISYFKGIEMVCVRVQRNEEIQAKLEAALKTFVADFDLLVDRAKTKGWIREQSAKPVRDHSKDLISESDLELILAANKLTEETPF